MTSEPNLKFGNRTSLPVGRVQVNRQVPFGFRPEPILFIRERSLH
jgi:hypothetical protein